MLKGVPSGRTGVEELWRKEAIWTLKCKVKWIANGTVTENLADGTAQKQQQTWSLIILSGAVHTRVEVHRMDSEMSGLVERPWLQLRCCAVCLPRGHNFR